MEAHLDQKLRNAGYDQLSQFGHPAMPKNFHERVATQIKKIISNVALRNMSIPDAYREIRDFVTQEYVRIYPFED